MTPLRVLFAWLLLWASISRAATVEFGWHPGTHGTADDFSSETQANVGSLNKALVFFAKPGDTLISFNFYGTSGDGNAEDCRMYLYTLSSDMRTLDDRLLVDTITGITIAAGTFTTSCSFALTPRTWYAIAGDSLSPSGGGFYGPHRTTTGTAAVMVPQGFGEDGEEKAAPGADPWGAEGTDFDRFSEMWGVVTLGTPTAGTRNKVTYVSDWDTTSGTGTNDSVIITNPGSLANGDVLIFMMVSGDDFATSGTSITVTPTGCNPLHLGTSTAGDDQAVRAYYKIVTSAAGEPATYAFVTNNAETFAGGVVAFRNVDTTAIADCSPFSNYILDVASNDPINRAVTTQTDSSMVVMFVTASTTDTGTVTTPTGTTNLWSRKSGSATAFNGHFAAYDLKETAGSTGDYTWGVNDVTNTDAHGFIIALRPKVASVTSSTRISISGDD